MYQYALIFSFTEKVKMGHSDNPESEILSKTYFSSFWRISHQFHNEAIQNRLNRQSIWMTIFQMADTSERGIGTCYVFFDTSRFFSTVCIKKHFSFFQDTLWGGCAPWNKLAIQMHSGWGVLQLNKLYNCFFVNYWQDTMHFLIVMLCYVMGCGFFSNFIFYC